MANDTEMPPNDSLDTDNDMHDAEKVTSGLLHTGTNGVNHSCDEASDSMTDDPQEKLEKAIVLIREAFAEAGQSAIDNLLARAGVTIGSSKPFSPSKPQRAPAGSARVLCERELTNAAERGLTANRIHDLAQTEYEKMLTVSAIRNELQTGLRSHPPRYKYIGGVWYLAKYAPPSMKVVS